MITWDKLKKQDQRLLMDASKDFVVLLDIPVAPKLFKNNLITCRRGLFGTYEIHITSQGRALIPAPVDRQHDYEAVCSELEREVTRHLEFKLAVKDLLQNAGYAFKLEYTERELLESLRNLVYNANGFEE